jgi:hypothetical protein
MKRENFTVARVDAFRCDQDKTQTIYWDATAAVIGVLVVYSLAMATLL